MSGMKRRDFLKMMGAGSAAVGAAALTGTSSQAQSAPRVGQQLTPAEMDEHHKEVVDVFLQNAGQEDLYNAFWHNYLEPEMDGDTKVFNLTSQYIDWETEPGKSFRAMAYNGVVPGPIIKVTEGDNIRLNVTNEMEESHALHPHGLILPNALDGVPYITQDPIKQGDTFVHEWTIREGNIGSHMYHSHHNSAEQTTKGLLGAFIVEPRDKSREPDIAADYVLILNDSALGFTLNGKSFPYTQPIIAKRGEKIRIRYMNEGLMIHPMHLHGIPQMVFAKDGFYLPVPYMVDTLNVAPGERYDVIVDCTEPGAWAFHCHILTHAESRNGMFGMVTALVVTE